MTDAIEAAQYGPDILSIIIDRTMIFSQRNPGRSGQATSYLLGIACR